VPPPVTLALAAALRLLPLQAAPAPGGDLEAAVVQLAEARARWHRALDAAAWDRDAPASRAAANEITAEVLPLASRGDDARAEALLLLGDLGADALGETLRASAAPDPDLVRVYLRRHDDAQMVSLLLQRATGGASGPQSALAALAMADDLSRYHRAGAGPILAGVMETVRGEDRERACRAALRLPSTARAQVAGALVAAWPASPPDDLGTTCVALGALTRPGRARLARWLAVAPAESSATLPPWRVVALLGLAGSEQQAVAARAAQALGTGAVPPTSRGEWHALAERLASVAPALPLRTPLARRMLEALAPRAPDAAGTVGMLRLRARDEGYVAEALEVLRNPYASELVLRPAVNVVGLAAGPHDGGEARRRLVQLRGQVQGFRVETVSPQAIDGWIEAIDRVGACRGARGCLVGLLATGSDAVAARAVFALGAAGLASLGSDEARPLVRRLALQPDPWLLTSFALSVEGCPRALRGVREAAAAPRFGEANAVAAEFFAEFTRACDEGR
jgi:hypothetical protein